MKKEVKNLSLAQLRALLTDTQNLEALLREELASRMQSAKPVNKTPHSATTPTKQIPYQHDPLYKIMKQIREARSGE